MLSVYETAALMRLGRRYVIENKLESQWVGRLPTAEEIDQWEKDQVQVRLLVGQSPIGKQGV